eukprot:COSAG02_NODE_5240_length_4512_cov_2.151598_1_plen_544_part_00
MEPEPEPKLEPEQSGQLQSEVEPATQHPTQLEAPTRQGMLLDAPIVVMVSSDSATVKRERPLNFHELALMMRTRQLTGSDKVFALPRGLCEESGSVQLIGDLIDMDVVEETDKRAYTLWEQLIPDPVVTAAEALLADCASAHALAAGCVDTSELSHACAEIAPPLNLCSAGFLRAPVALLPALAQVAERELGETDSVRAKAVGQLRRKMIVLERDGVPSGSPGIGRAIAFGRTDDQFLVAFLRANKYVVTDSLRAIVRYTRFVDEHADWLGEAEPLLQDETALARLLGVYIATGTTRWGRRVLLIKWSQLSETLLKNVESGQGEPVFRVIVRLIFGTIGRLLSDAHAQILGVTLIQDWESPPQMDLLMKINSTLTTLQKRSLLSLLRDVLPLRQTGLLALNHPWWLTMMMVTRANKTNGHAGAGWFPYLPDQISYEQLHNIVDPASLPVAFRGAQALRPPPEEEDQQLHIQELQMQQRLFTELLREMQDEALSAKLSAIQVELSRIMLFNSCEPGWTLEEVGVPAGRIHTIVETREDQFCALQ